MTTYDYITEIHEKEITGSMDLKVVRIFVPAFVANDQVYVAKFERVSSVVMCPETDEGSATWLVKAFDPTAGDNVIGVYAPSGSYIDLMIFGR